MNSLLRATVPTELKERVAATAKRHGIPEAAVLHQAVAAWIEFLGVYEGQTLGSRRFNAERQKAASR